MTENEDRQFKEFQQFIKTSIYKAVGARYKGMRLKIDLSPNYLTKEVYDRVITDILNKGYTVKSINENETKKILYIKW